MLPATIATQTVHRLRGVETTDEYGDTVLDWSEPDDLKIRHCSIQPRQASENTDDGRREEALNVWQLWAPHDADIRHTDRIVFDGSEYAVTGAVQKFDQLNLAHTTCPLRLVEEL